MKKLFAIAVVAALAGSLGACSHVSGVVGKFDAYSAQNLPSICSAGVSLDASFQAVAATQASIGKPLASDVIANEATAVKALSALCADPTNVNSATIIPTALKVYAAIVTSLAQAKKAAA